MSTNITVVSTYVSISAINLKTVMRFRVAAPELPVLFGPGTFGIFPLHLHTHRDTLAIRVRGARRGKILSVPVLENASLSEGDV